MNENELIHGVPAHIWNATKVPDIIGTCVFYIVLVTVAITLRLYARITSRAVLWWDDWFALATVVSPGSLLYIVGIYLTLMI